MKGVGGIKQIKKTQKKTPPPKNQKPRTSTIPPAKGGEWVQTNGQMSRRRGKERNRKT